MKLSELGEETLIKRLQTRFHHNLPSSVLSAIGDDCAVVQIGKEQVQLLTSDMLVESVHFHSNQTSPQALGYKALAVNLSDIASMGGTPDTALLSLGLPKTTEVSWIESFFDGLQELADAHHVHLIGGDLTKSSKAIISITLLGKANPKQVRYRNQARVGDILCTTGPLGDAGAGRHLLGNRDTGASIAKENLSYLIERFLRPEPHVKQGQWLAQHSEIHAMMDISDGLAADLPKLIESSNTGAIISVEKLPLSPALVSATNALGWNREELATCSGEDYCLLVSIDKTAFPKISKEYENTFQTPLYEVGQIAQKKDGLTYVREGKECAMSSGFTHFSN